MAIASQSTGAVDTGLQQLAMRHLWMHFSRMGSYGPDHEIPIIVRGEGCYVYDDHGKRYLDGIGGRAGPELRASTRGKVVSSTPPRWRPSGRQRR